MVTVGNVIAKRLFYLLFKNYLRTQILCAIILV